MSRLTELQNYLGYALSQSYRLALRRADLRHSIIVRVAGVRLSLVWKKFISAHKKMANENVEEFDPVRYGLDCISTSHSSPFVPSHITPVLEASGLLPQVFEAPSYVDYIPGMGAHGSLLQLFGIEDIRDLKQTGKGYNRASFVQASVVEQVFFIRFCYRHSHWH